MPSSIEVPTPMQEPPFEAAPWHASQPEILLRALMHTDNGPPRLAPLGRTILPRMPKKTLASQDLRSSSLSSSTGLLSLDFAVDCPWVTLDGQRHRNALVIDIDHPHARARWLALPTEIRPILVLDPWSGRGHAIVLLKSPVCVDPDARADPKRLASFAGRLLAAALGGTLMPHRCCVKWPWGRRETVIGELLRRGPAPVHRETHDVVSQAGLCWFTEPGAGPLELRSIVAALDAEWRSYAAPPERRLGRSRGRPDARGRNCALFDLVRWWAYDHVERDRQRILDQAIEVNGRFPVPLPAKEVASVAKSIAKFMAKKFRQGDGVRPRVVRGRDRDLNPNGRLSTHDAQSLAAARTNQQRSASGVAAIQAAAANLRASGEKMTQVALAKAAKVSIRTVRRHWTQLGVSGPNAPDQRAPAAGHTLPHQLVAVLHGEPPRSGGSSPDGCHRSLAEEAEASQRRHRVIESDKRSYGEVALVLSKRGISETDLRQVPWPRVVDSGVTAAWKLAQAASMNAYRRASNRRKRAKGKVTQARLVSMAQHPDPSVRASRWRIELSELNQEWDRIGAALGKRAHLDEGRRLRLRSLARDKSPELSELDLDQLEAEWRVMIGGLTSPIDHASLERFRTWAICHRFRSWTKALRDAGHR